MVLVRRRATFKLIQYLVLRVYANVCPTVGFWLVLKTNPAHLFMAALEDDENDDVMKTSLEAPSIWYSASGIVIPATFQLVHLIRSQGFHQSRVMELSPVFCDDMANSQMPVEFHIRQRYKNCGRDQGDWLVDSTTAGPKMSERERGSP